MERIINCHLLYNFLTKLHLRQILSQTTPFSYIMIATMKTLQGQSCGHVTSENACPTALSLSKTITNYRLPISHIPQQ